MKTINELFLETVKKGADKFKLGEEVPQLISEGRKVLLNFYHFTKGLKVIELASLLISINGWRNSKGKTSRKSFNTRDIIEVDLGLGHGYEMSYRHPCIVIHDSNDGFCFVVPCSTGKYGKNNKHILDGEVSDGFARPTGVLLDATRCVSKVRVTGKVGQITVPFLEKLNNELLQTYFSRHYHRLQTTSNDLKEQKRINLELQQDLADLEEKIKNPAS
jgi:mRNA-degrading endonuclease toxin of MazEF toxin-antitoxin module